MEGSLKSNLLVEKSAALLAVDISNTDSPSTIVTPEEKAIVLSEPEVDTSLLFIAHNMTMHLWDLAHLAHTTCDEKQQSIQQAIKEFDAMNTSNKNYQITRREALCSLAALPMVTLGLKGSGGAVQPAQYGTALAHCTASVEACWELSRSGDANDLTLAFQCVSKYREILETIASNSSQYRSEALKMAAHCALVKTYLGWHHAGPTATIQYAKDALGLSKETDDISLELSAYSKLAWAYFYDKKYLSALTIAQDADACLQQYTQRSNAQPLHPCIQGSTYRNLALMQAKNGRSPDRTLGKAIEIGPADESYAFMDGKSTVFLLETGWIYCYQGDQVKAMETLGQRVDAQTFSPKIPQSERGLVEAINIMALSSLKAKDRDMEKVIHLWKAGATGAVKLQSEQRFNEALTTYELMEVVWPGEQRVSELRDLIVHW
ncbi:MAG TPA: hypothetical protein VKR06_35895 [Ktedonosporobacter sp.]|nr:hypothetical protein [Ktedonosporobacter sp.]